MIQTKQPLVLSILMRLIRLLENQTTRLSLEMFLEKVFNKLCLKLIEGTVASIPPQGGRKHPQQEFIQIDTSNILFICGGAFLELMKLSNIELINLA